MDGKSQGRFKSLLEKNHRFGDFCGLFERFYPRFSLPELKLPYN